MIDDGEAYYAITLKIIKNLPEERYFEISFDNPVKKQPPIIVAGKQEIVKGSLMIESPKLECIKYNKVYEAKLNMFESELKENLLAEHSQKIEFSMPKKYMKQLGIKKC